MLCAGVPGHCEFAGVANDYARVCIIEACEDRDLSGAVPKRALVVTVLLAGCAG